MHIALKIGILAASASLAGCSQVANVSTGATSSIADPIDRRLTNFGQSATLQPIPLTVASTLSRDRSIEASNADGYAILALMPGRKQNIFACKAFFSQLLYKDNKEVMKTNSNASSPISYRPTYWLDKRSSLEMRAIQGDGPAFAKLCSTLLEKYDYERSRYITSHFGFGQLSGPLLIAWTREAKGAFAFDLSNHKTQKDFDKIIDIWQNAIASDPNIWSRRGVIQKAPWYISVREAFNEAGAAVETAVRFWFENEAKGQVLEPSNTKE